MINRKTNKNVKRLQTIMIACVSASVGFTNGDTAKTLKFLNYKNVKQLYNVSKLYFNKLRKNKTLTIADFVSKYNNKIKHMTTKKVYNFIQLLNYTVIQQTIQSYITFQKTTITQNKLQKKMKKIQKQNAKMMKKSQKKMKKTIKKLIKKQKKLLKKQKK